MNKVREECDKRMIRIANDEKKEVRITKNESLIEHAALYVEEKKQNKKVIQLINHMRIFKKSIPYLQAF